MSSGAGLRALSFLSFLTSTLNPLAQAAYVRAFQEKVRRREAELAAQGAGTAAPDDKAGPEKKKLRVDGDYSGAAAGGAGAGLGAKPVAGPAAVKAEPAAAVRSSGCPEVTNLTYCACMHCGC